MSLVGVVVGVCRYRSAVVYARYVSAVGRENIRPMTATPIRQM